MTPIVVSFWTRDTPYEAEAREMEQSARAFGMMTDVRAVPNLGDWTRNCSLKAAFIRDRMHDYPGRPIVWLDADARVRRRPELFANLDCDFAAHWRHGEELLSGTLYFSGTRASVLLASAWAQAQYLSPSTWDQKVLQSVIESGAVKGLRVERLPAEYVAIWDDTKMGTEDTWVISHHQASRKMKGVVNAGT